MTDRAALPPVTEDVESDIYTDPAVWQAERARVFRPHWNYLAHESEIPDVGDFVVRYILDDSILLTRGKDGVIRAFLNICRHRAMQVCRAEMGHGKKFTCPYHGWTYDLDGSLASLPLERPYFSAAKLDRSNLGLEPLARLQSWDGFIFGSLSATGPDLVDYLGDYTWYVAIHSRRDAGGLQVLGPPQRWIVRSNWKIGAENFSGDSYHAQYTHRSVMEIGLHPNKPKDFQSRGAREGINIGAGPGTMRLARQSAAERGYPEDMIASFRRDMPAAQQAVLFGSDQQLWPTGGHLFPNMSFLNVGAFIGPGELAPFLNVRLWRPLSPDETEIWSWVLAEKSASEQFKRNSIRSYVLTFGTTGTEEQDDIENFVQMQRGLAGTQARTLSQKLIMGKGLAPQELELAGFGGPGEIVSTTYTDFGVQRFHQLWTQSMNQTSAAVSR